MPPFLGMITMYLVLFTRPFSAALPHAAHSLTTQLIGTGKSTEETMNLVLQLQY